MATAPVVAATGGNEQENVSKPSTGFTLYPNPTEGDFTIVIPGISQDATSMVTVYSLFGEQIIRAGMKQGSSRVFSLAGRPAGVYCIRVESGHAAMTGKVVKL